MGAGHGHGMTGVARTRGRLLAAAMITAGFLVVEIVAAVATGSLTLFSDAGHMATDVVAVLIALAAVSTASRTRHSPRRTFGLYRVDTLAALANAVLLLAVTVYVVVEAITRVRNPVPVAGGTLVVVALVGVLVNVVAYALLRAGARHSLAVSAAATEVFADALGSLGVLVAGLVILATGAAWVDAVVALLIGGFIGFRAARIARQALRVLTQSAPAHIDVELLRGRLGGLAKVTDVHDLHVWTLASGMDVATAHLTVAAPADVAGVLEAAQTLLAEEFGVQHATVQVEPVPHTLCPEW